MGRNLAGEHRRMRGTWMISLCAACLAVVALAADEPRGNSVWGPETRSSLPAELVTPPSPKGMDTRPASPATQAAAVDTRPAGAATRPGAADTRPAEPASRPAALPRSKTPEMIERRAVYYLELYGKYLKTPDPLARTMVVISLAALDDPRCTEMLVKVMLTDAVPVVRVYAWEAVHARLDRVTPKQRDQWVRTAYELAKLGYLRGDLRVGLVGAMAILGPTDSNRQLFRALFENTNSLDAADMRTLDAMGSLLAQWKSPDLVEDLIGTMGSHNAAWRAEYVLTPLTKDVPSAMQNIDRIGSVVSWAQTQQRWRAWFEKAKLRQIPAAESRYAGRGQLLPAGEKIVDSADPKWRKDLELEKFALKQLDVGFVIDSTGSMGACINWIQSDVVRIMRGFELISREPRIGVTLYRDRGDAWIVNSFPLNHQADALAKQLSGATAAGGGDIPEAVLNGMVAVSQNQWSGGADAKKVIVVMGDAPPHEADLKSVDELVKLGTSKGFVFYAVKIANRYYNVNKLPNYDPKLATFDKIAALGGGKSFWIDFYSEAERNYSRGFALPKSADAPERVIFREVLKAAMAKGYEDRVDAFVNVLEQYIEWPRPEVRYTIPPWRPYVPGPPSPPPRDPQAQ